MIDTIRQLRPDDFEEMFAIWELICGFECPIHSNFFK